MSSPTAFPAGNCPLQTTRARESHNTPSLPSLPPSFTVNQSYGSQDSSTPCASTMEVDDEEHNVGTSTSAPPRRGNSSIRRRLNSFPYTLFSVLENEDDDEETFGCIVWYESEGEHGIWIPDIYIFCLRVLPKSFPGQKQWRSFHKQLNNHGFEKRDYDSTQGKFVHTEGMFRPGRRDLLINVRSQPAQQKTTAPQDAVQEQQPQQPTPGASTTANNDPGLVSPDNVCDWVSRLLQEFAEIKNSRDKLEEENRVLKAGQAELGAEITKLKNGQDALQAENERLRMTISKLEGAQVGYSAMSGRDGEGEIHPWEGIRKLDAMSTGDGSFYSAIRPGSTAAAFDNDYRMTEASGSSGIRLTLPPDGLAEPLFSPRSTVAGLDNNYRMARASGFDGIQHVLPPGPQTITDHGPDVPYQHATVNPASLSQQTLYSYPSGYVPSPHVSPSLDYAGAHSAHGRSPPILDSLNETTGLNAHWQPQIFDPTAGTPLFALNVPGTAHVSTSAQAFIDPTAWGGRPDPSVVQAPLPSPPARTCALNPGASSRSIHTDRPGSPFRWDAMLHDLLPPGGFPF